MQPIILHGHAGGPNPWKVVMVLEELEIPYNHIFVEDIKGEAYTKLNPNGRAPTIEDPNTGITLWESGAILEYLVDTYDKDQKLTYATFPEKYHLKQFLHFQMSGQGPYFGQMAWFRFLHPESLPSAKERYDEQTLRVFSVLDKILEGKEYLVGDKCTYADIAFVPWDKAGVFILGEKWADIQGEKKYPNFWAWHTRVSSRPAVQKALQAQAQAQASKAKH